VRFGWRVFALVFPLIAGLSLAPSGLAQASGTAAEARRTALFEEGRTLHLKGQHAEAVEKLSEVVRIRKSPQALRALGLAESAAGKLVAAMGHLRAALQMATESGPASEVAPTKTALEELSPRVPRVRVVMTGEGSVLVDEVAVASTAEPIEVDPGARTITARAAGKVVFTKVVQAVEREVVEVRIEVAATGSLRRPLGIGLAAAGGAGLVVGAITGILAIGAHDDLEKKCPTGVCPRSEQPSIDGFHALGTASTVGLVAGGVLAAAGAVVFFTAPRVALGARVQVTPFVGVGAAGARVVF